MNNRYSLLLSTFLLTNPACSLGQMQVEPQVTDLRKISPMEFLEYLKTDTRPMRVFTIREPLECWVSESDVQELVARLDSSEQSMSVALSVVSSIRKSSQEADEAAYLIKGFRAGKYPPTLGSKPTSAEEIAAIRNWWTAYKTGVAPSESGIERCKQPKSERLRQEPKAK